MDVAARRSNTRSLLGLGTVSLVLAAVVAFAPAVPAPVAEWRPPAGYAVADTVDLGGGRTVRLWTGPWGWYVESRASGRHDSAAGAGRSAHAYWTSEILGVVVGHVPETGAAWVAIGSPAGVRAPLRSGMFVVPAPVVGPGDRTVSLTPLDATGRAGATVTVEIAGRG